MRFYRAAQHGKWRMRCLMVNFTIAFIFKGNFETQKLTKNGEKFAEIREQKVQVLAVYLDSINHNRAVSETNDFLKHARGHDKLKTAKEIPLAITLF
jgi:hypothetical protein